MRDRYASLREGLVGAWIPSVSGSGLLLPDLSGRGNNGTLTNMGPEDWVSGKYGRALDFDGVDDYVELPDRSEIKTPYSVSVWFKRSVYAQNKAVFCHRSSSATTPVALQMYWPATSLVPLRVLLRTDAGVVVYVDSTTANTIGNWYNAVAVRHQNTLTVYINGVNEGSSSGTIGSITVDWLTIGAVRQNGAVDNWFNGQLDDIRIYDRALSEPEIKLLASRPGIGLRPQRRTMYYAPPTGARRRRILTSMP